MSENRAKRRSFFFFNSDNTSANNQVNKSAAASTGQAKASQGKISDKTAFKNTNPFIKKIDGEKETTTSSPDELIQTFGLPREKGSMAISSMLLDDVEPKKPTNDIGFNSNNPFNVPEKDSCANTHDRLPRSSNTASIRRRPPPPVVDLKKLQPQTKAQQLNNTPVPSSNVSEILEAANPSLPVSKHTKTGHQRQKSDVDRLVDDLDNLINERSETMEPYHPYQPIQRPTDMESLERLIDRMEGIRTDMTIVDNDLESPIANVSPLSMDKTHESREKTLLEEVQLLGKERTLSTESMKKFKLKNISCSEHDIQERQASVFEETSALQLQREDHSEYGCNASGDTESNESGDNEDQFSFASSDDDSVQNLQQISFNKTSGAVPVISGLEHTTLEYPMKIHQGSISDQENEVKPRQFRVVNEDKANFYLHDGDTTTEDDGSSYRANDDHNAAQCSSSVTDSSESEKHLTPYVSSDGDRISSSHTTAEIQSLPTVEEDYALQPEASTTSMPQSIKGSVSSKSHLDKSFRLVSSYVEELRLKYFPTSNSLQPPPNLPIALKTKNNLERPQNIKVRIRTSSKQIGIKHGKAKQKLLSLETTNEEDEESVDTILGKAVTNAKADHTKEFQELFVKENGKGNNSPNSEDQSILEDIPGDEAYDSDDLMAPLRERGDDFTGRKLNESETIRSSGKRPGRSDTVTSYFTRNASRLRSGTLDGDYDYASQIRAALDSKEPSNEGLKNTPQKTYKKTTVSNTEACDNADDGDADDTSDYGFYHSPYSGALRVANPDSESD